MDSDLRKSGYALLVFGLLLMVGAFFFPVAGNANDILAPPIANMNRVAIRAMLHTSASTLAIIGALFAAVGEIRRGQSSE